MTDKQNPDAPLCGDVDGPRTCMSRPHHGHHVDGAGHEWPQWYVDGDDDLWVSVDETGDRVRLVVVGRKYIGHDSNSTNEREDAAATYHGLTPVRTAHVAGRWEELPAPAAPEPARVAPELPDTVYVVRATYDPHPAEGAYLSDAAADAAAHAIAGDAARSHPGQGGYTAVVTPAGDIAASILAQPLHTDDTPHGLPVVDQAAVTAALDATLPRDLPEDKPAEEAAAPGLSFGDALASFFAYIDDEDDDPSEAESARAAEDGGAA